jgi:Fe-S cluster biogenesis protein NfuA
MADNVDTGDARRLRETGERIEGLLSEIGTLVTPAVQAKIDAALKATLDLYAGGLGRLVDIALATGAEPDQFRKGVVGDELVSSLLLLHGLHPLPAETRIERALELTRPVLQAQGLASELDGLDESGTARVRIVGAADGRTRPWAAIREAITRCIEEAAPEVRAVEIEGMPPESVPSLVQLRASVATAISA